MATSEPVEPLVSVVIPVRDEVDAIESAIRSALAQDVPGGLEVVVADAMSIDGTRERVAALAATDPRVVLVDNPRQVTPAGLNAAIAATRGRVIVRVDAHSALPAGYIARAVEILDDTGAAVVGGIQAAVGERPLQRAIAIAMTTPLGVGDARFHLGGPPGPVDTVYLGVFRRDVLDEVGGFDESLVRNQDYELNYRIRQAGHTVYFHPDLRVEYRPRASLGALWRQYFDYGRWKRIMLRRHPGSLRWRQLAAPALVIGLVASGAVALTPWRVVGAVIPGLYLAAVAATAVVEAVRRQDPAALLVPLVLPTMHLAWGLGFLFGRPPSRPSPTNQGS